MAARAASDAPVRAEARPSAPVADNGAVTLSDRPRDVVILGSTGSIGTQALDIIRRNPDRFRVVALAAGGGNADLLARQAAEFGPAAVAVATPAAATQLEAALHDLLDMYRTDRGASAPLPDVLAGLDRIRDTLAIQIKNALNAAAFSDKTINGANRLTGECQDVIDAAAALAQHA